MSQNQPFNRLLDAATQMSDCAVHILDTEDALEAAIGRTYKATIDYTDALRRGEQPDPRKLLIAWGGLRAILDHVERQVATLGGLLTADQATATITPNAASAK